MRAIPPRLAAAVLILATACTLFRDDPSPVVAYFERTYAPTRITESTAALPEAHHIATVPWVAYRKPLCQTASLEMLAPGAALERDMATFLLGYTYGALYVRGAGQFMSFGDPEPGFAVAADVLGLRRSYRVTDDPELFLRAIRETLARDVPVRLAWNSARTFEAAVRAGYFSPGPEWKPPSPEAFSPHSVVLAGYKGDSFFYFETGGRDQRVNGELGIAVQEATVLEAVSSLAERFRLPWRYMLLTLEGEGRPPADLKAAWQRNGEELVGIEFGPSLTGSRAIAGLAGGVAKDGKKLVARPELRRWLAAELRRLEEQRRDGAAFLDRTFDALPDARRAAAELGQSSDAYAAAAGLLEGDDLAALDGVVALLRGAGEHERRAGEAFLAIAGSAERLSER